MRKAKVLKLKLMIRLLLLVGLLSGFAPGAQAFYNPSVGSWLNRDPIGEKGGLNLYGFVYNTPVNAIDLFGLKNFRLGFYGLGPKGLFGNQIMTRIGAAVGADMYAQNGSPSAVAKLLREIDADGNRQISASEASQHSIKVFGYSYGGIAAIGFAQRISKSGFIQTGGSPKSPSGYSLCSPIPVQVLLTIDPVQLLNPAGGVPDNVESFVNYYQRKGGYAVFRNPDGSIMPPPYDHFGTSFSAQLNGSEIQPVHAKSSAQYQVETGSAGSSASGLLPGANAPALLNATEVNHDVMPFFVEQTAIGLMQ